MLGALTPGALSVARKGERVLKDLKHRSLVKMDTNDRISKTLQFVTIHDLLLELGRSIAHEGRVYSASGGSSSWSFSVPTVVQHLFICKSDFVRVPTSVIAQAQLKSIVLSGVTRIPSLLDLRGCQLVMFDHCSGDFFNPSWLRLPCLTLEQFSCSGGLATLRYPPDLRRLSILQYMSFRSCQELTRGPNMSGLTALQHLDLSKCMAMSIPPDVRGLHALRRLELRGCVALTSPPNIQGLTGLQVLDLSGYNALTNPPDVRGLAALQS
jgi:hypothetical protein